MTKKCAERNLTRFFVMLGYGLEKSQELAESIVRDKQEQLDARWIAWRKKAVKDGCLI